MSKPLRQIVPTIHRNVGINSLKNITKASHNSTARFLIDQETGAIHAGDMSHFDHGDLAPMHHNWDKPVTNGYITYSKHPATGEDQYHMASYRMNHNGDFLRDINHPVIKKMEEHGIQRGILSHKNYGHRISSSRVRPLRDTDNKPNDFEIHESSITQKMIK